MRKQPGGSVATLFIAIWVVLVSGFVVSLHAAEDVCSEVADRIRHGGVIWTENAVVVQGTAAPDLSDPSRPISVIKAISKRAATLDAYRKAAGILAGVRVSSEKTAAELPRTVSRIDAYVQHAAVCKTKYFDDGGVDVVVWLPLGGAYAADVVADVGTAVATAPSRFSSVIVNASNLPFAPALVPRLLSGVGTVLFDQRRIRPEILRQRGAVTYVESMDAVDPDLAGGTPLLAHAVALGAQSPSDLVVDDAAAGELIDNPAFLGEGRIIIVTGTPRQIDCRGQAKAVADTRVDWENRRVLARGHGRVDFSRPLDDAVRMRMMERAAEVDAQRKLLAAVLQIRFSGTASLGETAGAQTRVGGVVRNAVRCGAKYFRDGSAEVVLAAPLDGLAVAGAPAEALPPELIAIRSEATGLLVDATGVGFHPVLAPRLLDPDNRVLYGPDDVSRAYAGRYGAAGYHGRLPAALSDPRVGDNPMIVLAQAVSEEDPGALVLGAEDAQRVAALRGGGLLTQGRVVIVVGESSEEPSEEGKE